MWWASGPGTLFLLSGGLKPAIGRHEARVLLSSLEDVSQLLKCPLGQISFFFFLILKLFLKDLFYFIYV